MEHNSICIMLPTYKRTSELLPRFLRSAIVTADKPEELKFAFCINENDHVSKLFLENYAFPKKENVIIITEKRDKPHLAIFFNRLYDAVEKRFGKSTVVTMLGDDMEFITPDWDTKILHEINKKNGIGVFWCNDDYIAGERCPVNLFVTMKMVELTETKFMDETFPADMIDVIWGEIGKNTGTAVYFPKIIIKHHHTRAKDRKDWDATFIRLNEQQAVAQNIGKDVAKKHAATIVQRLLKKGISNAL